MKALITGITGFAGSHLAEHLIENKYSVVGIKRRRSPLDNISHLGNKICLVECELRDLTSITNSLLKIKPDVIFHLAAQSFVPTSFDGPLDTFETNTIGTYNLLQAVRNSKINPIIQICSTADVYGIVKKNEVPIDETTIVRPISPYAVSKAAAELIALQHYYTYKTKVVITRAFNHTGPRRDASFAESSFAKQIAQIEKGIQKPFIKVGDLGSVRTYGDVRDIVKGYRLLTEKGKPGEIYNIAGDSTLKIGSVLKKLISLSAMSSKIKVVRDIKLVRKSDYVSKIPNDKKFRSLTGWKPEIPLSDSLLDLLDYWRRLV